MLVHSYYSLSISNLDFFPILAMKCWDFLFGWKYLLRTNNGILITYRFWEVRLFWVALIFFPSLKVVFFFTFSFLFTFQAYIIITSLLDKAIFWACCSVTLCKHFHFPFVWICVVEKKSMMFLNFLVRSFRMFVIRTSKRGRVYSTLAKFLLWAPSWGDTKK